MKKTLLLTLLLMFLPLYGEDFQYMPGATYDPSVPTLEQVVGHRVGERVSSYGEIERYINRLAEYSPKVEIVPYAKTWEGRNLYLLTISSEANIQRLAAVKEGIRKLAFPDPNGAKPTQLLQDLPAVVWLAYGVHGNEISSPDAALQTVYHLLASQNDPLVESILNNCVIIIDPQQNPDGRDRFVSFFRQATGRWPDGNRDSTEHSEPWPGGRSNHYLFDMNRDWFAMTQPETQGRTRMYQEWYPQVFADLHEMGGDSTYYFAPPAKPLNPVLTPSQQDWLQKLGANNGKWFDKMQFDYFTREVFDSFYPGYGEGWPMFQGSIGMTYEQASVRGLVYDRSDETTLHFRESVQHHFIASISTLEAAANNRAQLVEYFYDYRLSAIEEGKNGDVKEYILPLGKDPNRTRKMVNLLLAQGIEIKQAKQSFTNSKVVDHGGDGSVESREFPAGSFIISLAQPGSRLTKTLLDKHTPMDDEFLAEQKERRAKRLRDQFYDVTGWSFPLLYGVDCLAAHEASKVDLATLESPVPLAGGVHGEKSTLAYLVPWGTNSAAQFLAALHREDIRVFSTDEPFSIHDREFPRGTLIIKVKNNPDNLFERVSALASEFGVDVYPTNSGWVESGVNFGSNNVQFLKKPTVALAYDSPTSSGSAGATRFVIERMLGYPVTIINTERLAGADLNKFNVLILPNSSSWGGGYSRVFGERGADRIREWVRSGGTLIGIGSALDWMAHEKVGLLSSKLEEKETEKPDAKKADGETKEKSSDELIDEAIQPEKEGPDYIPGALMKALLDNEHWMAYGCGPTANVMVDSRRVNSLIKLDKGKNVGIFAPEDEVLVSGFAWDSARKQLANNAFLMHEKSGRGNVVAFVEDPNYRAFMDGLNLLFYNAILLGPAH